MKKTKNLENLKNELFVDNNIGKVVGKGILSLNLNVGLGCALILRVGAIVDSLHVKAKVRV